jgi:hypothetical protein
LNAPALKLCSIVSAPSSQAGRADIELVDVRTDCVSVRLIGRGQCKIAPLSMLLVVVGGSFVVAAIAVFARLRAARFVVFMAAFVALGWLIVQIGVIGYVSWMQPATAIAGLVILILGSQL